MPIDSVHLWESNYRQGDVGAVSESLRRFGQKKPIVVQASTRIVVAGNHVLKAALMLGWQRVAAVVAKMSDTDAAAYAIADNRTSDLATNDDAQLTALLKRLVEDEGPDALVGTGYDGEDLDALLKHLEIQQDGAESGLGTVNYQIVVQCADEGAQGMLCEELEGRGFSCRLLAL